MAGFGRADGGHDDVLLAVDALTVEFPVAGRRRDVVHAVTNVSLEIRRGETVGLVGESGCGKSTLARAVVGLVRPTSGTVTFEGMNLTEVGSARSAKMRTGLQMIFQNPTGSLNPRRPARGIVSEGLAINRAPKPWDEQVQAAFSAVGLDMRDVGDRLPSQLSGGQCQRLAIARALVLEPTLLVCDEAVSSLDVSVQAQILNLLEDTKLRYSLTLLFISHDLNVVRNTSDRVVVMYLGRICEVAPSDTLFSAHAHPYTDALLGAIEDVDAVRDKGLPLISGELPSPIDPPPGCRFHTRCPRADERCRTEVPLLQAVSEAHFVACHHPTQWDDVFVKIRSESRRDAG